MNDYAERTRVRALDIATRLEAVGDPLSMEAANELRLLLAGFLAKSDCPERVQQLWREVANAFRRFEEG